MHIGVSVIRRIRRNKVKNGQTISSEKVAFVIKISKNATSRLFVECHLEAVFRLPPGDRM